jgi:NifU-like protein involved in Fe-S cluster formation
MDEAIIKFYRRLLKEDFPNAGELKAPAIFVEAVGEKLINCGNTGNFMQLYLLITDECITEFKYLCACEPIANVAVEVLCDLVRGMPIEEAAGIIPEQILAVLGTHDEALSRKVCGLLEMLNEGIAIYRGQTGQGGSGVKEGSETKSNISWDATLSA